MLGIDLVCFLKSSNEEREKKAKIFFISVIWSIHFMFETIRSENDRNNMGLIVVGYWEWLVFKLRYKFWHWARTNSTETTNDDEEDDDKENKRSNDKNFA